jgi:hypothetical protein
MKFLFKPDARAEIGSEDPWYALTLGGYLRPEHVLKDVDQVTELNSSIAKVRAFIDQCYENGVIEEA